MTKAEILKEIDKLLEDYERLMHKAMDENKEKKVYQFNGSCVALEILRDRIERSGS